jgi:hypothetical protein
MITLYTTKINTDLPANPRHSIKQLSGVPSNGPSLMAALIASDGATSDSQTKLKIYQFGHFTPDRHING